MFTLTYTKDGVTKTEDFYIYAIAVGAALKLQCAGYTVSIKEKA